jgi:hypothetical protein
VAGVGNRRRLVQGIPLQAIQNLCAYWADDYDWRLTEARLNDVGQFRTEIDGLGIHFLHVRPPHPDVRSFFRLVR